MNPNDPMEHDATSSAAGHPSTHAAQQTSAHAAPQASTRAPHGQAAAHSSATYAPHPSHRTPQQQADHKRRVRWLVVSQSITLFGTGIVFPFYVVFTRQIGANFSQFGIAYALFSLSAAATHAVIGRWSDRFGRRPFLLINSWGTAFLLLFFPLATTINQVYVLQAILGVFGAMHRTSEKAIVADITDGGDRGRVIGAYHGWVSIFSALAVIAGGYLIDLFSLSVIFYIASPILFVSGIAAAKIVEPSDLRGGRRAHGQADDGTTQATLSDLGSASSSAQSSGARQAGHATSVSQGVPMNQDQSQAMSNANTPKTTSRNLRTLLPGRTKLREITLLGWGYVALFLGVVVIGHVPGVNDAQGRLFGLFHITLYQDLLHGGSGVWAALAAWHSARYMIGFFRWFGTIYFLDGVLGSITGVTFLDFGIFTGKAPIDGTMTRILANAPHIAIGGVAMLAGFVLVKRWIADHGPKQAALPVV